MNKIRLFIIDDNKLIISIIKKHFKDNKEIEVVMEANDGEKGIDLINKYKDEFDLIILDLIMPKKDGIEVLEYLNKNNIDKKVIVLTAYNNQDMISKVSNLGASYYMIKPNKLNEIENRIKSLSKKINSNGEWIDLFHNNIQRTITKILHELGMPSHIKGYRYIREGITLVYENPNSGITKELYPTIAKRFDSTVYCVERDIRHAIEVSWNRGNWDLMEDIFGHSIDLDKAKPTNSEFIITIAEKMRLDYNKPFNI